MNWKPIDTGANPFWKIKHSRKEMEDKFLWDEHNRFGLGTGILIRKEDYNKWHSDAINVVKLKDNKVQPVYVRYLKIKSIGLKDKKK